MAAPRSTTSPAEANRAGSSEIPPDPPSLLTLEKWDRHDPERFERAMEGRQLAARRAESRKPRMGSGGRHERLGEMVQRFDGYFGKRLKKIDPGFALRHALRGMRLRLGAAEWPAPRLGRTVLITPQSVLHTQIARSDLPAFERFPTNAIGTRMGGDWDRAIARIDETAIYKGLFQRFAEGRVWDETALHPARYRGENPEGRERYSRFSEDEFRARAAFLDRLHRSMAREGWVIGKRKRLILPSIPDVLICNVTRDGTLVRNSGGMHRLIIAQLAGLESVPVIFAVVHEDWNGARNFVRIG